MPYLWLICYHPAWVLWMVVCRYSVVYSPYGVKVLFFNLCCILAWCSWFLVAPPNQNERTAYTSLSSTFLFHVVSRWKNRDEWEGLGGSSCLLFLFLFSSYFSNGLYVWCRIHSDVPLGLDYQHLGNCFGEDNFSTTDVQVLQVQFLMM